MSNLILILGLFAIADIYQPSPLGFMFLVGLAGVIDFTRVLISNSK